MVAVYFDENNKTWIIQINTYVSNRQIVIKRFMFCMNIIQHFKFQFKVFKTM